MRPPGPSGSDAYGCYNLSATSLPYNEHQIRQQTAEDLSDDYIHLANNCESSEQLKPGFHYPSWRPELTARQLG